MYPMQHGLIAAAPAPDRLRGIAARIPPAHDGRRHAGDARDERRSSPPLLHTGACVRLLARGPQPRGLGPQRDADRTVGLLPTSQRRPLRFAPRGNAQQAHRR